MMIRLKPEAFARARHFLKARARPLERAMFEFRFEGAGADAVAVELAHFQNEDGGFGHALEPDLRTPSSSALATGIGLRMLRELGCSPEHPMVRKAVHYLLRTCDHRANVWRVAPEDSNAYPHAPWWHDEDGSLARTFGGFLIIPRAELVALLLHFSATVPHDWLHELAERTVADIEAVDPLGTGGGSDLIYALRLAETEQLPTDLKRRLVSRVRSVIPAVVSHDAQEWESYVITPLRVAPSPRSSVADLLRQDVQAHLDYVIEHQKPEGTWDPTWTWGDSYPEVWKQARLEWRGKLTLETLTVLQAYDRIAEQSR
ncbi:MAG: hypothetical protein JSW37_05635 [Anaerolineales bacterium]|nr:MAG: hypothetical protein JSW37_05635 [Anaerolineales bacterium]